MFCSLLCLMGSLKEASVTVSTCNKTLTYKRHLKCLSIKKRVGLFNVSLWGAELKCKKKHKTDEDHNIGI